MIKLISIAKNTFTEILRQPVFVVIILAGLFLFFVSPAISLYTMDEDIKLLRELGLSTLFLCGLFIAIFSSTGAITEEIESKTITTVLSKPVGRPIFILGKFLGITAAVLLAHYILTIAMMMSVRHGVLETASDTHDWPVIATAGFVFLFAIILTAFLNYIYDWSFPATTTVTIAVLATFGMIFLYFIDREWKFNPGENGFALFDLYASILLLLAVIVLVSVAVMFSTRMNLVLTLGCSIAVFLVGLISDYIFGRFADQHIWAKIGQVLIPNLQTFWVSDALYEKMTVPPQYLGIGAIYAAMYTFGMLMIATALFQRRQVG